MKIRESGMPQPEVWHSFFDPPAVLAQMGLDARATNVVDFGCGYGTFSIAAARCVSGTVHALDIDPAMLRIARLNAQQAGVTNINFTEQDFVVHGAALANASADYVMVFNILHLEQPVALLQEARRILRPGGTIGVVHWNYDARTPRGPPMDIRPQPQQCIEWAQQAGLRTRSQSAVIDLPPYHYGIRLSLPGAPDAPTEPATGSD